MRKSFGFVSLLAVMLFSSCNIGFTDFPSFFKNYTEEAAIEVMELDREYPKDKDGNVCISSEDDKVITFYLRNPQHFTNELGLTYEFLDRTAIENDTIPEGVSLLQDNQDDTVVRFTLTSDYLTTMEMGGVLDATFELFQNLNGNRVRDFPSYNFKLNCNSEPPSVRNLTVLQYAYSSTEDRYVLAFNMPDMSTIHKDIATVTINGKSYDVDLSGAVDTDTVGLDLADGSPFVVKSSTLSGLKTTGSKQEFLGEFDSRAVYFKTEQVIVDKEIPFEIVVTDKAGLSASSSVTAFAERLDSTTASYDGEGSLSTNDDGYIPVTFYAPAGAKDATVYFVVYDSAKSKIVKQGHNVGSVSTTLAAGSWIIESWAHKSGYVDSYAKQDTPVVGGALYVDANYDGSNGTRDGGKATPWTSIDDALNAATVAAFPGVTLVLKSDIALNKPLTVGNSFEYIALNGQNSYKVTSSNGSGICIDVSANGVLRLINIGVGNVNVASDSSVTVMGSTHSVGSDVIELADEYAKLYVQNKTGSEYTNIKYTETPDNGWEAVIPATAGSKLSDETLDLFKLQNAGFYIGCENGVGVVKIPGVSISVPSTANMCVDLTANSKALTKNASGFYTVKTGSKLNVTVQVIKSDGKKKSVTVTNLQMCLSLDDVDVAGPAASPLTVPSVRAGKYFLNITFEYDGLGHTVQVPVYVEQ